MPDIKPGKATEPDAKPAKRLVVKPAPAKPLLAQAKAVAAQPKATAPKPAAAPALEVPPVAIEAESVVEDDVKQINETLAAATAPADEKEETMETTVNTAAETVTAKGQAMFADMNERAKTAMSKSGAFIGELNEFGKGNVEAIVESSKIAAKGLQQIGQDAAEYGRKSFEHTTAAFKGMAQVKSPTELAKLHSDYVRSVFDAMVAETSRSTEAMLKLAGEVAQPISNRVAVAAQKVKIAA